MALNLKIFQRFFSNLVVYFLFTEEYVHLRISLDIFGTDASAENKVRKAFNADNELKIYNTCSFFNLLCSPSV